MLQEFFINIYTDSVSNSISELSISFESNATDVFQSMAQDYADTRTAELVTKLDESTKNMLRSDLESYMQQGLTPAEISKKLEENYAFSESRSLRITRTETGFAWNHAGIMTAKEGGAKGVKVYDGDHDKDCQNADGQNWTFDYALEHLLEHPNCVRSFGIMASDEEFDQGVDDNSFDSAINNLDNAYQEAAHVSEEGE